MDTSLIALDNIPTSYSEELMTEYVENTLGVDVQSAKIIGGLALFSLEQDIDDFKAAKKKVKKASLEGRTIHLLQIVNTDPNAVVIYANKPDLLDKTSMKTYIVRQFKTRKDFISEYRVWQKYELGIIHFKPGYEKLVRKLKEKHNPVRGATVIVQPYYYNFHDLVEKRLPSDEGVQLKMPSREKNASEFKEEDSSESDSGSDDSRENRSHRTREVEQESDEDSEDQCERESDSEQGSDESASSEDQRSKNTARHKGNFSDVTGSDGNNSYTESEDDSDEKNKGKQDGKVSIWRGKKKPDGDDITGDQGKLVKEQHGNNYKQANSKDESLDTPFKRNEVDSICSETKSFPAENKELAINEAQYLLLKKHFGTFDNCKVEFIKSDKKAVFKGGKNEIDDRYFNMFLEYKDIDKKQMNLLGCLPQLLTEDKGKAFLKGLSEMESVAYCVDNDQLLLASKNFNSLNKAAKKLREVLNYKNTLKLTTGKIPDGELNNLKTNLEKELLVKVSWSVNQDEIFVEGVKDDVLLSEKDISGLVEKFSEDTKTFVISSNAANYLLRHPSNKIKVIFQNVKDWKFNEGDENDPMTYTFCGQRSAVKEAECSLQSLVDNIVTRKIDLQKECSSLSDIKLIMLGLGTEEMKSKLEKFEKRERCFLKIQLPDETGFKEKYEISQSKPDIFTVEGSCRIQLKKGDIITETSDVLVCVFDKSFNLKKTQVGKAFSNACPQLNEQFQTLQNGNPSSLVHVVNGPFPPPLLTCKAVFGVVLSVWDESYSPGLLQNIITNVLDEAVAMGAKSVSLPTLGHGRMFKFPSTSISQIMMNTLHSYLISNQAPSDVIIMTTDQEMLDTLKLVAHQSPMDYLSNSGDIISNSDDESTYETDEKVLQDLLTTGDIEISVTMAKLDEPQKTLEKLTDLIRRSCLHSVQFEHTMLSFLAQKIEKKTRYQFIHIQKFAVAETGKIKMIFKGFEKHVQEIEKFITNELSKIQAAMKNKILASGDSPTRGTVDFLMYASNVTEICPSYWGFCKKPNYFWRLLGTVLRYALPSKEKKHEITVAVDKTTRKAIVDLFEKTWDATNTGIGNDAKGLSRNTSCEVLNVERIENPALFELYAQTRKNLFEKYCRLGTLCDDFSRTLPRGQIKTTEILPSSLREQLYHEVNEHYLFHGTKKALTDALCQHGPDPKLCTHAMLGAGLYFAEASMKSDQYADERDNRTPSGEELKIFLMRVLLGNTYIITRDHQRFKKGADRLKRPPCAQCESDRCADVSHQHCDSVTLDGSPGDNRVFFREFVVYDTSRCYPEYIITYKRKP
ncbi:unnamed protein product [Lymnaea stagnalis]|uniref:Poly [ADP-ribose] polymerase n=1 Tax=Lymnaea stagnalis TaxID=6523 RepID=A0AAV2IM70_LYMST